MTRETITILGREITYEIRDVDVRSLEYDPGNPRINSIVSRMPTNKITQELIGEELLKLGSTKDLIKDLEANKGIVDESYVLGNKFIEGIDDYVHIEDCGRNTRRIMIMRKDGVL
jgi:hypothetical protein